MNINTGAMKIVSTPRGRASHVEAKWADAEELCLMFGGISRERLYRAMVDKGLACKESNKPTLRALKLGVVKVLHHGGHDIYKWNKRFVREELDGCIE